MLEIVTMIIYTTCQKLFLHSSSGMFLTTVDTARDNDFSFGWSVICPFDVII